MNVFRLVSMVALIFGAGVMSGSLLWVIANGRFGFGVLGLFVWLGVIIVPLYFAVIGWQYAPEIRQKVVRTIKDEQRKQAKQGKKP